MFGPWRRNRTAAVDVAVSVFQLLRIKVVACALLPNGEVEIEQKQLMAKLDLKIGTLRFGLAWTQ